MAKKLKQHPGIRQRGHRWQVRVCVNGEHLAKSFATHTEALEFYREHKEEAGGSSIAKRKEAEKMTFGAFLARYYAEYGVRKRGRRQEHNRVKRLSQEPFAAKRLLEVDTSDFVAYISRRREGGASDPTIRLDVYLINHAYNYARTSCVSSMTASPARPSIIRRNSCACFVMFTTQFSSFAEKGNPDHSGCDRQPAAVGRPLGVFSSCHLYEARGVRGPCRPSP